MTYDEIDVNPTTKILVEREPGKRPVIKVYQEGELFLEGSLATVLANLRAEGDMLRSIEKAIEQIT